MHLEHLCSIFAASKKGKSTKVQDPDDKRSLTYLHYNIYIALQQADPLCPDGAVEKDGCTLVELRRLLGSEQTKYPPTGYAMLHICVAEEIVLKAACNIVALRDNSNTFRDITADLVQKFGIMRAAEYDGIYQRVGRKHFVNLLSDEIVCTGPVGLTVFHQRNPHGTGYAGNADIGKKLGYLQIIGAGAYGAGSGKQAYVAAACDVSDTLCRGAYDAKNTIGGSKLGKILLLDSAEGLGRSSIAGQYDQGATLVEKVSDSLKGKFVDHLETVCPIRGTGIVAQIKEIIFGHEMADCPQDGQSAISAIKNAYRCQTMER